MRSHPPLTRTLAVLVVLLAAGAWLPVPTAAQQASPAPQTLISKAPDRRPPGFRLSPRQARRIADRLPAVRAERRRDPELRAVVEIPLYLGDPRRYEVTYVSGGADVRANVHLSGLTGEVLEVWTGPQADNLLARGYEPHIGVSLNRPYVWLPLAVLFLAPFVDPRRPFRVLHLDLLVLLAFGVSQLYFNRAEIDVSVPLVYPLLGYLLLRLLLAGLRPRERASPAVPFARTSWLAIGLVALVVFRVGLNVADSVVIDVGYASVVGADRIAHGLELYVDNEAHGDAYGPVAYLAYLPFELAFPNDGTWGSVPAAHAAAIAFDLLTIVGLMLLGTRLRRGRDGRRLGLALAYAWAAYPFTLLALQANTNDGLVAALLAFTLLSLSSPAKRGMLLGLAAAAKFAPLALAPLLATGTGEAPLRRSWPPFVAAFAAVAVLSVALFLPDGGLREAYDATIGFQLGRHSAFSLWGLHPSLSWAQDVVKLGALTLAALLAFAPRPRSLRQVAALGGAALVAAQLAVDHWFYFYLVWIAPFMLVASLGAYGARHESPRPTVGARRARATARRRSAAPPPRPPSVAGLTVGSSSADTETMALLHDPDSPAPPARATAVAEPPLRRRTPTVALYSTTLALSAALVFMVQPMFARFVLPLLGGTPAVWTTTMLFFQTALLLAYLYAHWATRRFGARRQAALHLALVAAALLFVPIGIPDGWTPPDSSSPVPWLLLLLLVAVGLPFFVVSATAPLLQSWLAETDHPDAADPYFLYRASNAGSVLGLLAYPFLVERELTLDGQSWLWSGGYVVLAALLTACAVVLWRAGRALAPTGAAVARDGRAALERIGRGRRVRWVALAFVPSSLMLGATTALTTNVAPVPLLWVLPLSLYLFSFILVFSRGEGGGPFHRVALVLMPPAAVALAGVITIGITKPLWLILAFHLVGFFFVALACHGELAADRPPPAQLTQFYAFLSLGGALGGVFNVIVAPQVFNSLTEYPLVLALACFLLPMRSGSWSDQMSLRRHLLPPVALAGAGTAALLLTESARTEHRVAYLVLGLLCVTMARNPLRFGLAVGLAMVAVWIPTLDNVDVVYQDRGFFGVKRVEAEFGGLIHKLKNGTIVHGAQIGGVGIDPVTYYHRTGPMGQLLEGLPDRSLVEPAAVIGLGAGTMACLSQPGEHWTFFEIDPAVLKIARRPKLFSFLRDCKGDFDVVLGDGRLSLERQDERFGLIALDAFSSDAIPIHLMTREALDLYVDRLEPEGVLAFHISNNYLDLEPVVGNLARAAGLTCYAQQDTHVTRDTLLKYPSHWAVLARSAEHLGRVRKDRRWHPCQRDPGARTWSDDYSNVLGIVRWN